MKTSSTIVVLTLLIGCLSDLRATEEESNAVYMPERHMEVFNQYCLDCHDADTEKGQINLEDLSFEITQDIQTAELWADVLNVINSGEMPPEDKTQIPANKKFAFLKDLSHKMVTARKILNDSGGEITMRRINRREYENTIYSLLGEKPDTTLLPKDEDLEGFDTNGMSLSFSSQLFEVYQQTAKATLNQVMSLYGVKKPEVKIHRTEVEESANAMAQKKLDKLEAEKNRGERFLAGETAETKIGDEALAKRLIAEYKKLAPVYKNYLAQDENRNGQTLLRKFPRDDSAVSDQFYSKFGGKYSIRYRLGTLNNPDEYQSYVHTVEGLRKVTGTLRSPQIITVETELSPQGRKKLTFGIRTRDLVNRKNQFHLFNAALKKTGIGPDPYIWVDWIEVEGPIHQNWPPYPLLRMIGEPAGAEKDDHQLFVRRVLKDFAKIAFRGKEPSAVYLQKLEELYFENGGNESNFSNAIVEPFSIILASPSFVYLSEPLGEQEKRKVSDRELAIRLSYFLWSAPPDDELINLARAGSLSKPNILRQQTERLLNDPRSMEFIRGFTYQWLGMLEVDTFQFSDIQYPHFDENIRSLAKEEVYQSVRHILTKNLPLKNLIHAPYVMVNDLLADYYGISGVKGNAFQPVQVPLNSPRGGLPGMAALHVLGSDGVESNLVRRGAWILEHLLHDASPPPPANIPQLSQVESETPIPPRDRLLKHTIEPQCAQCHKSIDPIGYGLENFDATGRWRDEIIPPMDSKEARMLQKQNKARVLPPGLPIDPSGKLPDGTTYRDFFELRERLMEQQEHFTRGFLESLISYGLGREYSITDEDLADKLYSNGKKQGNTIRQYIHQLVQSPEFNNK